MTKYKVKTKLQGTACDSIFIGGKNTLYMCVYVCVRENTVLFFPHLFFHQFFLIHCVFYIPFLPCLPW